MSRSSRTLVWALIAAFFFLAPAKISDRAIECDPVVPTFLGPGAVLDPGEARPETPAPPSAAEPRVAKALELSRSFRASDKRRAIACFQRLLAEAIERRDYSIDLEGESPGGFEPVGKYVFRLIE